MNLKVTTELKNLIKAEFANKRKAVENEIKLKREENYKAELEKMKYNKTFNEIKKLFAKLYDEWRVEYLEENDRYNKTTAQDFVYLRSEFKKFSDMEPEYLLGNNKWCLDEIDEGAIRIAELKKQEQSLLIKLTYEKDLEVIKQMLAEYDINIL